MTGNWLLNSIVKHIGIELPDGVSRVLREVNLDGDIPDIVVEWPMFKLLIENKTKSSEHSDQCKRYLKSFGIKDQNHGQLIFLSPSANPWPKSISRSDQRVHGLSYRDLAKLLELGLVNEQNERAEILVMEYLREVDKLTGKLSVRAEAPVINKGTKLLASKWPIIMEMHAQAAEESTAFIEWSLGQALKKLNESNIGTWTAHSPFGSTFFFTRNDWNFGDHLLGIAYSAELTVGSRILTEYSHIVGVRMEAMEGQSKLKFRALVRDVLNSKWDPDAAEALGFSRESSKAIRVTQSMWPVYKSVKLQDPLNWEVWTSDLCEAVVGFARAFSPALSAVSERINMK